jgi:hypothetical protein
MAAGLGFKDFTTGEVLTAADVDGYLMQGIWVFASNAARDAAVTAPAEGNFAFTKDTNSLWYYDGAAWVASGATGDIEGVTAGIGISGGGTSGTVTVTNSMATAIDAKGDLVVGTGADTFSKLTVGANGTTLVADSAEATGLKWAAASAGGTNWSLLNSGGTNLTGATTVSVSGISGKDQIMVVIAGASAGANDYIYTKINGSSASIYKSAGAEFVFNASYSVNDFGGVDASGGNDSILNGKMSNTASSTVNGYLLITGCNSTGVKVFQAFGMGNPSGSNGQRLYTYNGIFDSSDLITSILVGSSGSNLDAGKVYVYTSA